MGCLQHRGLDPGGVVEVWLHPERVQLASIKQLDGDRVERLTRAQRPPGPRPQHSPPLISDQPLITDPGLQHELGISTHHPAGGSGVPERVRVPVVGHQHRHNVASWLQIRRDVVLVIPQPSRLRSDRTPANLGTVDPQHVPRIRRQAKRCPRRNKLDVEHPTKLGPREFGGRKIRTNTRRIDHELGNIRGNPVTAPPHARESGSRHIRT
jgi:hypothetical protein